MLRVIHYEARKQLEEVVFMSLHAGKRDQLMALHIHKGSLSSKLL